MADNFNYVKFVSENKIGPYFQKEASEGPVSDYGQRRAGGKTLSAQAIERMDGLVDRRRLQTILDELDEIKNELETEGFDEGDVVRYIHTLISDYIGRP